MSSYSDIRIINGSLDEVTRDLIRFFHSQGFNISATACKNSDEAIHLRAENKTTSFWKLIKSSAPQIVDCQLSKFGNDQTQIELTFHSLKIFQNCLYGISFALYCFMAGGLWLSLKFRTPDTTLAAWGDCLLHVFDNCHRSGLGMGDNKNHDFSGFFPLIGWRDGC